VEGDSSSQTTNLKKRRSMKTTILALLSTVALSQAAIIQFDLSPPGTDAAVAPTVTPAAMIVTGATGSGVALLTGPAGAAFYIQNVAAASMRFYCVGGTINGTTGTTAYIITNTGNKAAWAFNTSASGAWFIGGNT